MIRSDEIFKAASCPLVPGRVVHDTLNSGAESALTVVTIVAWAAQEVMVHSKVVAEFVSQELFKRRHIGT